MTSTAEIERALITALGTIRDHDLPLVLPPVELGVAYRDRFWRRVDKSGECWMWTGATIGAYGQVQVTQLSGRRTVTWYAHRMAWHLDGRPLHEGLTLDHLCRTTLCVNPAHLEEVTLAENIRRVHRDATHCKRGHAFSPENTIQKSTGGRQCRICANASQRRTGPAKRERLARAAAKKQATGDAK